MKIIELQDIEKNAYFYSNFKLISQIKWKEEAKYFLYPKYKNMIKHIDHVQH